MEWRSLSLDLEQNQPLYRQIAGRIGSMIDSKALAPGERIPTSKELKKLLNVSYITVEAGIGVLVERNYLVRRPRKGTFVNPALGLDLKGLKDSSKNEAAKQICVVFRGAGAADQYWFKVLWGLERGLRGNGYGVSVIQLEDGPEGSSGPLSRALKLSSGAILCGHMPAKLVRQIERMRIPLALIGGLDCASGSLKGIDAVAHDDVHRAYISTMHLIDLGHRDLSCVCGPSGSELERDLQSGFKKALADSGIELQEGAIASAPEHSVEAGIKAGYRILCAKRKPSALFAGDDRLAAGIVHAALKLGMKVPDDLSVIGCGGLDICQIVSPKLATTASRPELSAELAVEKLLAQFKDPSHAKSVSVIRVDEISYGESTMLFRKGN